MAFAYHPLLRSSILALALSAPASQFASAQAEQAERIAGWQSDITFYLDQLRRQHYTFASRPLPPGLIAAADALARNIPRYSDERMLAEFAYLASFAGDGHTYILPFAARRVTAHLVPLRFFQFSDGLYVIDSFPGHEQWIGSRVLRIGDTPAERVIERMRPALSADNRFTYLWTAPALLSFRGYLEKFADGVRPDSVSLTLRSLAGKDTRVRIAPVPAPPLRGLPKLVPSRVPGAPPPPLYLARVAPNFWFEMLTGGSTLYFQFNQVADAPNESIAAFAQRLDRTITEHRPRSLIVDVRHNNGGNLQLLPPLMSVFRRYESSTRNARIYVLMGRNTFSAAQVFLAQMDRDTRAVFAGEPSSSKPNFVGEESEVMLPWSGAIGSISDEYHETIPGDTREWIEPQIRHSLSSRDYFANKDPLLRKVLTAAQVRR